MFVVPINRFTRLAGSGMGTARLPNRSLWLCSSTEDGLWVAGKAEEEKAEGKELTKVTRAARATSAPRHRER